MSGIKYMFNSGSDMRDLARKIQSDVFWNHTFIIEEDSQEESVPYQALWNYIESYITEYSAIGIFIDDDDRVTFLYKE